MLKEPTIQEAEERLKEMKIPLVCGENSSTLQLLDQAAEMYGMHTYGKYVDLSGIADLRALEGTLVTHEARYSNNGVYVFCIQEDQSIGMFVVIPSTISKAPMIKQATGDLTSLITGADLPLLTTFDKVEITGFVIANTVIKPLMDSLNIPKSKRRDFEKIYLPRFMSNVARQYLGSEELKEEIIELEPQLVKQMLTGDLQKEVEQESNVIEVNNETEEEDKIIEATDTEPESNVIETSSKREENEKDGE